MLTPYHGPESLRELPPPAFPVEPMGGPVEPSEGVNWARIVSALVRYKWLILAISGLGLGAGVLSTRFITPEYQVGATIFITDGGAQTQDRNGPIRASSLLQSAGWVELLRSFAVVDPVVRRLKLYVIPKNGRDVPLFDSLYLAPKYRPGHYALELDHSTKQYRIKSGDVLLESGSIDDSIGRRIGVQWHPSAAQLASRQTVEFDLITPREASLVLNNRLLASLPDQSNFLRLRFTGTQSKQTAATLNEWIREYVSVAAEMKRAKLSELTKILGIQLAYADSLLKKNEVALESFRVHAITLPAEGGPVAAGVEATRDPVMQDYFAQKIAYENARRSREALERILAQLQSGTLDPQAFFALPAVLADAPALRAALEELQTKEVALRSARQFYTDEHKSVRDLRTAVDTLRLVVVPRAAMTAIAALRQREAELDSHIQSSSQELRQIPGRTIEEMGLRREVAVADNLYRTLQSRYAEARLAEASATPDIAVLDTAVAPQRPEKSKPWRFGLIIIVGSIGAALVFSLVLDQLDRRFRYPEQATNDLRLPIVGTIPALSQRRRTPDPLAEIQVVESFRALRLQLQHLSGRLPLMITVTSPGSGDGKSLLSANLALSFADAGNRALLIDGDIRRGAQHTVFGASVQPGLLNHLAGQVMLEEILQQTPHEKLRFISRGTRVQGGPELLASAAMADLIAQLRTRFDAIIIDSPPLGAGIDPLALAVHTRNLLMVLRIGETDRKLALAKLRAVSRLPVHVIGAVLNDVPAEGVYKYYAYGYGADEMSAVNGSFVSASKAFAKGR